MRPHLNLFCLLACGVFATAAACAAQTAPTAPAAQATPATQAMPAAASSTHRVELPGAEGKPFPYTVEIPVEWQVREVKGIPGLWLGPHGAEPPNDPRLIYVRLSQTSLADPAATVAAIRANDASQADWSAPLVEVREVGGVRGVLVRMDSGEADKARSTLTLKLPVGRGSVDFMSSGPRARFEELRPAAEKVLLSVQPLAAAKTE
jgi:hypothetical protein